jgi:hypothetical protein
LELRRLHEDQIVRLRLATKDKSTYAAAIMARLLPNESLSASGEIDERRLGGDNLDPAGAGALRLKTRQVATRELNGSYRHLPAKGGLAAKSH